MEKKELESFGKVVTFGEIMLRLSQPHNLRFFQTNSYDATFGEAEANTAFYYMEACYDRK